MEIIETVYSDYVNSSYYINETRNLTIGKYYIRFAFESYLDFGLINMKINRINSLSLGSNNLMSSYSSYQDKYYYIYTPNATGMYDISLIGLLTYDYETMMIYENQYRIEPLKRMQTAIYDLDAVTSANCNNLVVYLQNREVYNTTLQEYQLQLVFPDFMVTYGESLTWANFLTDGIYYIEYYNKVNTNSTISIAVSSNGY